MLDHARKEAVLVYILVNIITIILTADLIVGAPLPVNHFKYLIDTHIS